MAPRSTSACRHSAKRECCAALDSPARAQYFRLRPEQPTNLISLETPSQSLAEGDSLDVYVTLSQPANREIKVEYWNWYGAPAAFADDYDLEGDAAVIQPGETRARLVRVQATSDSRTEPGERLIINLIPPALGTVAVAPGQEITLEITDPPAPSAFQGPGADRGQR